MGRLCWKLQEELYQTNNILEWFQMRNKFKFLLEGSLIHPGKNISVGFCIVVGNLTWESWISPPIIPHSCVSMDSEMDMLIYSGSVLKLLLVFVILISFYAS